MAFFSFIFAQNYLFMKKLLFPLMLLMFGTVAYSQDSYIGAFSQGAGLSDSRLMDAVAEFTSKMRNKMVLAANIKGSPYFEEGFQKGRLDYFGRDVKGDAFFVTMLTMMKLNWEIILNKKMQKKSSFKVRKSFAISMRTNLFISL